MLSSWFRIKYPNIVEGALAASAPVRQFVVDCESFLETTTNTFKKSNPECPNIIRESWDAINNLAQTSEGLANLTKIFHICDPVQDVKELKDFLNDLYGNAAMGDYPYEANFLSPLPAWPVTVSDKTTFFIYISGKSARPIFFLFKRQFAQVLLEHTKINTIDQMTQSPF
jgi:lysosomal Pro-X carboxypeptidase